MTSRIKKAVKLMRRWNNIELTKFLNEFSPEIKSFHIDVMSDDELKDFIIKEYCPHCFGINSDINKFIDNCINGNCLSCWTNKK